MLSFNDFRQIYAYELISLAKQKQLNLLMNKRLLLLPALALALLTSGCVVNTHTTETVTLNPIERHYFNDWEVEIGYAQAVVDGHTLYVSGIPAGGANMQEAMQ